MKNTFDKLLKLAGGGGDWGLGGKMHPLKPLKKNLIYMYIHVPVIICIVSTNMELVALHMNWQCMVVVVKYIVYPVVTGEEQFYMYMYIQSGMWSSLPGSDPCSKR